MTNKIQVWNFKKLKIQIQFNKNLKLKWILIKI